MSQPNEAPIRVLVIDDDPDYTDIVRYCLSQAEAGGPAFVMEAADRLKPGLELALSRRFDAALVDLTLPDAAGLEAPQALMRAVPALPVLVATGQGDEELAARALGAGIQDYIAKAGFETRHLKRTIRYAMLRKSAQENVRRLEKLTHEIQERCRADEAKDRWLGTIAHELRTPLTIIKGAAIDLHEGHAEPLRPQQQMLVGLVRRQAERVERLVTNLLDLARLQSGAVEAHPASMDPGEIVRRVVGDFARAAADRAVLMELAVERPPRRLSADPELFEQLVVNLVDNAIRFARTQIVVRVGGDDELLVLSVEDDGVGIPAEKRELLFSRYGQLERRREVNGYKGTGLGLAICKEIVTLHRGNIEAQSQTGKGTAFHVRLPAGQGGRFTPPPQTREQGRR